MTKLVSIYFQNNLYSEQRHSMNDNRAGRGGVVSGGPLTPRTLCGVSMTGLHGVTITHLLVATERESAL